MRLTSSRTYYQPSPPKMPPGLMELMEGLTKEVLKHNPSDVYGFCAGHMQQLLHKRDGLSSKKSLSLEEKIAKAQKKVREKAEIRRQEYDKNLVLQKQNHTSSNSVNDSSELAGLSILGKDNITQLERNEVPQNMLETPIDQEQVLQDLREQEISLEPGLKDVVIENNVKLGGALTEENYVDSKSINLQYSEKGESVCEVESSYESPIDLAIANELSANPKPDAEAIDSDLSIANKFSANPKPDAEAIDSEVIHIVPDTFILPTTTDHLNQNQKDDLVKTDVDTDIKFQNSKLTKIESKESLTPDSDHNIPKDKAENEAEVEISKNKSASSDEGPLESLYDNKTVIEDLQIPNKLEHESSSPQETVNNFEQFSQIENGRLSALTENIQLSNESKNFQTDGNTDVIDSPIDVPHVDKSKHSDVLNLGKDIKEKYEDHVQPFTNAANNVNVSDAQEHPVHKEIISNITKEVKQTEIDTHVILPSTGVDGDIQTMVTENLINDTHEINNYENDFTQVKTVTPHDNVFQESDNKPHLQSNSNTSLNTHDNTKSEEDKVVDFTEEVHSTIDTTKTNEDDIIEATTSNDITGKTQNENQGSNMDLETAAITIQKVFRNFLFKSRGSTFEDTTNDEVNYLDEDDKNKEECDFSIGNALNIDRRAHGITRMDTVLQTVNEEKSLSLSTDDSSTLSSAATIIQSHVRGFLVRNKLNLNKTISTNSLAATNSNEPSLTSIEAGCDQNKNKTVLNIHIVPGGDSLSRDESLMTSMDLSLDSSPPSSTNLHPLGYDKSERRKQLKREDAIQSISPPSNNSGKLSEDHDSVKELSLNGHDTSVHPIENSVVVNGKLDKDSEKNAPLENGLFQPVLHSNENIISHLEPALKAKEQTLIVTTSDETDVVTPSVVYEDLTSSNLMHSSEFHDAVLPTRVSRSDTSVVSGE